MRNNDYSFFRINSKDDFEELLEISSKNKVEYGFIGKKSKFITKYSVKDNVTIKDILEYKTNNWKKLNKVLKDLDLYDIKDKKIKEVTFLEEQKIALAREIYNGKKVIIVDEQDIYLDENAISTFYQLLKDESMERTIIVNTDNNSLINSYDIKIINKEEIIRIFKDEKKNINKSFYYYHLRKYFLKNISKFILTLSMILLLMITLILFIHKSPNRLTIEKLRKDEITHLEFKTNDHGLYESNDFADTYIYNRLNHLSSIEITEVKDFNHFKLNLKTGRYPNNNSEIIISSNTEMKEYQGNALGKKLIISGYNNDHELEIVGVLKDFKVNDENKLNFFANYGFREAFMKENSYGYAKFDFLINNKIISYSHAIFTTLKDTNNVQDEDRLFTRNGEEDKKNVILKEDEIIINLYLYNVLFKNQDNYLTISDLESRILGFNNYVKFDNSKYVKDTNRISKYYKVVGIIKSIGTENYPLILGTNDLLQEVLIKNDDFSLKMVDTSFKGLNKILVDNGYNTDNEIYLDYYRKLEISNNNIKDAKYIWLIISLVITVLVILINKMFSENELLENQVLESFGYNIKKMKIKFFIIKLISIFIAFGISASIVNKYVINNINKQLIENNVKLVGLNIYNGALTILIAVSVIWYTSFKNNKKDDTI
ncbi:P-loop NTPase family protein [Haploplasma axanthum]|uniref:Macrolide export ATP-binding/permease protein MacB n=1 Tax=Haploplasma axanthum TaxID=29552 RepID=A0A449BDK8_HAPAX|nr:hypothetical protein [Haploplasma axanthum]VEU80529.1 Macrolide export ATP-binding/permease protein MacB [Haploplasma axanthum]